MKRNMAFKFRYNDGGKTKVSFGYKDVCTDDMINYNIKKAPHGWCANEDCMCRQYYDRQITRSELDNYFNQNGSVCNESTLLTDWTAYSGQDLIGAHRRENRPIRNADYGRIAILTTVHPKLKEIDRQIFAVYMIDEISEFEGFVASNLKYRIEMTLEESRNLKFWNYYSNENSTKCQWSFGLYRYIYDEQAAQILKKIARLKKGKRDEDLACELLAKFCKNRDIDVLSISQPSGSRTRNTCK